ncbi:glucose N-acetyltransferase [Xylogone sp. PMI_703]|nr:glucose N-acetyltransferase [Xylogone sp. PMI_703]
MDEANSLQVKPRMGQILRSKRVRITGAALFIIFVLGYIFSTPQRRLNFDFLPSYRPSGPSNSNTTPLAECTKDSINWSRFAYTQYVTNTEYLCNSVMLFEILHRLGSKADRLMMYPSSMHPDPASPNQESQLLLKAQNDYGVKLMPIEVQHRAVGDHVDDAATWADSYTKLLAFNQTQYERVLSLDSDSTVLQPMDELFLLPPCPVAMPRAYWLDQPFLSSQLVLIQPSKEEFARIKDAIDNAKGGDFDMEIVNNLYGKDCMIIPHRRYDLLTGEFRSKGQHLTYLGNEYEHWDPEKMLKEAKFLHFSDWPMPKPWLTASPGVQSDTQPKCDVDEKGNEDCRARDMWLGFYSDFKERRKNICGMPPSKMKARSVDEVMERRPWEFVPVLE